MGFSHAHQARVDADQAKRLNAPEKPAEAPQRGDKRGQTVVDHRRGGDAGLRGVPVIGVGAGAIRGTSPGGELGAGRRLEQAGRDIVASRMRAARQKLKEGAQA